jgi:DNA topoisomerase-2
VYIKNSLNVFGNIVAKETDYAHNEQILEKVISGMTQDFPTANNMPYFRGKGQFGSQYLPRASSGRYTHIEKSPWLRYIFREEDDHILPMVFDEGRETEPEHLIPIIPMTLVNGACGIANGFSTFIPQHNPLDIINSIEQRLSGEGSSENLLLSPWYRGHKGTVELLVEDTPEQRVLAMQSYGCYEELKDRTVITELPIGTYGEAYRKKLNMWRENFTKVRKQTLPGEKRETADETRVIKDFNNLCKKNVMRFEVTGMENPSYQALGLVKRLGMTNMTLLTTVSDNHTLSPTTVRGNTMEPYIPKRYESTEEYLDRFIKVRLYYYSIRKNYLVEKKKSELEVLKAKFRFIRDVVNKVVDVFGWKEQQILDKMAELGHPENLYSQTPIRRFCPEEVSRLESQIKVEEDNLKTLLSTESKQMWLTDLGELKDVYLKHYKGEDGIRKSQQRKIKLVKVKKGTIVEEDTIDDLLQVKDPQNNFEEETQDEYTE